MPTVDVVRYLGGLDCDFAILKMDIEGAEVPVLEGLLDAPVISRIAHVFVETHDNRIPSLAAPSAALRERVRGVRHPRIYMDWE